MIRIILVALLVSTCICEEEVESEYVIASAGDKVCIEKLPCVQITKSFFDIVHRPINLMPRTRLEINTRFTLFTRKNSDSGERLIADNPDTILKSSLVPKASTKFLIHGFLDNNLVGPWLQQLKDELLKAGDYNVIIVNWDPGNFPPYTQAVANTMLVGAELYYLIRNLHKVQSSDCHLIGHSLGAHICGYTGKFFGGKLGRITALDPAGPYFQNMPAIVRLDRSDAKFVEAIHTDCSLFGFGMWQTVGHVDIYPNGGTEQPACVESIATTAIRDGLIEASRTIVSCNHQRAVQYYKRSINFNGPKPVAYNCPSWKLYKAGQCADCGSTGQKCVIVGIQTNDYSRYLRTLKPMRFYIATTGEPPYWLFQYQVTVKLASKGKKQSGGDIWLTVFSETKKNTVTLQQLQNVKPGSDNFFLVNSEEDLKSIKTVSLKWIDPSYILAFWEKKEIYVSYVKIVSMNSLDKKTHQPTTQKFCGNKDEHLTPLTEMHFNLC